ncbi:ASCH domain-containing protein [Candidatus Nitrososphaera evergladensis SR1]|uniref:ASCH domain-containing protein n=1 Tax=Candidatus Nitrososphaera evergladensis SR1 TaxID=1459636 RepID=A0A075MUN6_9ARCH|nr:ASCH domain-containing protein [Candidatus Nitrososphaera evergladensis SR1]
MREWSLNVLISPSWSADIHTELVRFLSTSVSEDNYWGQYLTPLLKKRSDLPFSLHLAVLVEPYLQFILEGKKTVESRFSSHRVAPYQKVANGDVILLKRSGGPIMGICEVTEVWYYRLDPRSWLDIKREFTNYLCVQDPSFWSDRKHASFATLMRIDKVATLGPLFIEKKDRRGWVILYNRQKNNPLVLDI